MAGDTATQQGPPTVQQPEMLRSRCAVLSPGQTGNITKRASDQFFQAHVLRIGCFGIAIQQERGLASHLGPGICGTCQQLRIQSRIARGCKGQIINAARLRHIAPECDFALVVQAAVRIQMYRFVSHSMTTLSTCIKMVWMHILHRDRGCGLQDLNFQPASLTDQHCPPVLVRWKSMPPCRKIHHCRPTGRVSPRAAWTAATACSRCV